ncbi:DUF819 domain-containing protein [Streptomyces oceani]|uniref:DUF819 domain-containing protein n=1 Tax=Streptomyces oceani TaxID=1075402 RepID=A0A1E7KLM8_9ACTN|nr:DUF819 family protein [Streptomyces oceani]OEV04788.1 hypothetical protein AN216_05820 [Streptomyces oceani]
MITDGFLFFAIIMALSGCLIYASRRSESAFFTYVPGFVLLYFGAAALNTLGVFGDSDSITNTSDTLQDALLPAMILLLLFKCDIRRIIKLGPKLLLTYAVAAGSVLLGFVVAFLLLGSALDSGASDALGALSASWTGGSANMVAVQDVVEAPKNLFGYVLIVDTVLYSVWLLLMFGSVGFSEKFNRWTGADSGYLDKHKGTHDDRERPIDLVSLGTLIGFSLLASAVAGELGELLPELGSVVNSTTWTILIVSVAGLVIAATPLGETAGSSEVASVMLYAIIGLIASGSDFSSLTEAPVYLLAGGIVLLVHAAIMIVYAKLARVELFSLAVSSTANIGGVASAPVVASAFHRQLVPVGVLLALIGSFAGTFLGLTAAQLLSAI